jgi:uroporphyrinogen decarboxylase
VEHMSAWERVSAALAGQPVDYPPVSIWRHFPEQDQTAAQLTEATLAWQARHPGDFVKLMPPGDYGTIDWGAASVFRGNTHGTRETTRFPVATSADWARLRPVPVDRGMLREVVESARLVNARLGGAAPVLQTIFSPLTTAMKLSNGQVIQHLRDQPDAVHAGLQVIADVTRELTRVTLERGAGGIFFATQCATADLLTVAEYQEFGARYDLEVLAAAASRFTLLHLHGQQPLFDELCAYPVQAFNWHDQRTPPALAEGQRASGRCVVGGIDEEAVATMRPEEAAAQARSAVAALAGRQVMIAPGCVIPTATPATTIDAILQAVRGDNRAA